MSSKHRFITNVLLSSILTIAMTAAPALVPLSANSHSAMAATTFSDISDHWSKAYVEKAVGYGIVNGYEDGTFRPDRSVTRAEFTKMINTAIGNSGTVVPQFTDVESIQWFYTDIAKGVAAGFINGYDDYSFRPDSTITRQEAAVILSRIVPAAGQETSINSYDDASDVAIWAEIAMRKIVGKKYMTGADNQLMPLSPLTRGQAAKIIVEIKDAEKIITSNQTIVKDNVTIENTIYANQISVGTQVGSGTSTLNNCVVLGNVNVLGGGGEGDKGVVLKNSRIVKLTVDRDDYNVQVFSQGETSVLNTYINDSASLIETNQSESGEFGKGFVKVFMNKKSEMTLSGTLDLLQMQGPKCDATIESGSNVRLMYVFDNADRCDVTLEKNASMDAVDIYGDMTSFYGRGKIAEMNVFAESLTYTVKPTVLNVADTVKIKPTHIVDPTAALTIVASPENGAASAEVDSDVILKFSAKVHLTGAAEQVLTNQQAASLFELKKGSSSGSVVPCDVTVGDDGTLVTISPKGSLAHGTDYVLEIKQASLTDEYGNTNDEYSYRIHTSGSTSTEKAELSELKIGLLGESGVDYSTLSTAPGADNTYYIGTDSESLVIKASTSVPNPLIRMTMGSVTKTAAQDGTASFAIASGTVNPGTITITAGSYDGDYEEQTYTVKVNRINPNVQSAVVSAGTNIAWVSLYNSINAAQSASSDTMSVQSIPAAQILMTVAPQEEDNADAVHIVVEKYNTATKQYDSLSQSVNSWVLGTTSDTASASGIYRITLTSRIGGTTPLNGSVTRTTMKYVNVSFTS